MADVAVLSLHTSPLTQPGSGDAGGMNVYVRELAASLAQAGVDTLELATDGDLVDALVRFIEMRRRRARLSGASLPSHLRPVNTQPVPAA